MKFEKKYTYRPNPQLGVGGYICECKGHTPTWGRTKSTARSKMLRQIRRLSQSSLATLGSVNLNGE